MMKPRERILTVLKGGIPDQVPWMEISIDETLQTSLMGQDDFAPGDLCEKLGMAAFGFRFPIGGKAVIGGLSGSANKDSYYSPQKVSFDFFPPFIAESNVNDMGRTFVGRGLLTSREAL